MCDRLYDRIPQAYGRSPGTSPYVSFKKAPNSLEYLVPLATTSRSIGILKLLPVRKSVQRLRLLLRITLWSLIGKSVTLTAVSYTHLDVYKRQSCAFCKSPAESAPFMFSTNFTRVPLPKAERSAK